MDDYRILTLRQPWASLVASGAKSVEVRSWSTSYRGPIVILAGKGRDPECSDWRELLDDGMPAGKTVCIVDLLDCVPLDELHSDASCVPRERFARCVVSGHFAWLLSAPRAVPSLEMRGALGLVRPSPEVARRLAAA